MSGRKKHYTFKLNNIKPDEIDKQYGFNITDNAISITEKFIPIQSTKIIELKQNNQNISLMDELKTSYNAKVSLLSTDKKKIYNCYWDKHPIDNNDNIVYCPIEKINKPNIKTYISHINGKQYKIQDSINCNNEYKGYYTDGVFCGTECCLAFIRDNGHNSIYQYSELYLKELYPNVDINRIAPHWRILQPYGGNTTIEDFRKSFINITYTLDGVSFHPISFVFKESYHL